MFTQAKMDSFPVTSLALQLLESVPLQVFCISKIRIKTLLPPIFNISKCVCTLYGWVISSMFDRKNYVSAIGKLFNCLNGKKMCWFFMVPAFAENIN